MYRHTYQQSWQFQPTPPRGERRGKLCACLKVRGDFNPRPREGSDRPIKRTERLTAISTHAPARGATSIFEFLPHFLLFQPTPPRGERLRCDKCSSITQLFQPTPPRGERHSYGGKGKESRVYFNPRPREGSDTWICPGCGKDYISTHAPARGATSVTVAIAKLADISTHAPARGATYYSLDCI